MNSFGPSRRPCRTGLRSALWLCAAATACAFAGVAAQTPPEQPAAQVGAKAAHLPELPPALLPTPSPAEQVRKLLALKPEERAAWLKKRSPIERRLFEERLRELERLSPTEREIRLRLWELRHYLSQLLSLPRALRPQALGRVPAAYREALRDRLAAWDRLPADLRQELLRNRRAAERLLALEAAQKEGKTEAAPAEDPALKRALARWRALPPDRQKRILANFQKFFDLSPAEREAVVREAQVSQKKRLLELVRVLEKLPQPERARRLAALRRFAAMSPEQQARFLRNAARWAAMTPEQRAAWRRVAAKLPPLPPGLTPPPPLPPGFTGPTGALVKKKSGGLSNPPSPSAAGGP